MRTIQNSNGMTLEVHTGRAVLYHMTDKRITDRILETGLLPSEYGDIDINNDDGRGVYAIRDLSDTDSIMSLAGWLHGIENTAIIKFRTTGKWYICIDETIDEDDYDYYECSESPDTKPHYGYIVHPDAIPKENILEAKSLSDILNKKGITYPYSRSA